MKEINVLKHQLKKKIKISQSLIVVFLITGSITYAIDIADSYINDGHLNEVINFTETTSKLINNGLIDSSTFNSSVDGGEIMNNGIIYNGKFNLSKGMKNFLNLGTIFGRYNSIILKNNGNIVNNGVIDTNIGNYTASTALRVSLDEVVDSKLNSIVNTGFIHGVQVGISFSGSKNLKKTSSDLKEFINRGTISTFVIGRKDFMQYQGVQLNLSNKTLSGISNIENINNSGLISSVVEGVGSTIGFYVNGSKENANAVFIEKFLNNGVISGYADAGSGKGLYISNSTPYQNIQDAIKTIINNGLIKGNETGIFTYQLNPSNIYLNNGILAGKAPSEGVNFTNNGLKIFLDSNGGINKIEIGNGGNVDGKEIVNGTLSGNDSFTLASQLKINDNIIINGAGTLKGSLVVDNDSTLYNTIINGYNTALFLEDNTNFVGSNIIINGGGVKNNVAVVKGSDGENSLKLLGDSIVNGNLELENGNDNLVVSNTVQLNGSLDGGLGEDNLNLGEKKVTDTKLNIFQKINNFENILTNGSVVLFETSKITGAKDIVLETGDLTLRIDPTKTLNGKIIGHALYENEGTLSSTGGDLIIGLNGLGENATISMGKLSLKPDINNKWWRESDHLKTNSLVLDAQLKDGDVFITTKKNLDSLLWKSGNTWNITQEDLNNLLSNNEALLKDGHYIGLDYENAIYHTIKIWTINQSQEVYQKEFDILKKDGKIVEFEGKTYVVNNKNNTAYEVAVKPWVVAGKYDISTSKLDELIASGVEIENKNGKMYAVDRTTNKAYEITNWTEKPFKELTQKEYDSLKVAGEIKTYKDKEYVVDSKNNTAYEVAVKPWVIAGKYDISKNKLDELIASGVEIENKNGKMYAVDRTTNKAYEITNWTEKPFKELTQKEYDSLKATGEIKIYKDKEYVVDSKNNTAYEVVVKPWVVAGKYDISTSKLDELIASGVEIENKNGKMYAVDRTTNKAYEITNWTEKPFKELTQKEYDSLKAAGEIKTYKDKEYVVDSKNNTAYEVVVKPWVVAGKYDISTSKLDELIASGVEIENKNGKMYAVDRITNKAYEISVVKSPEEPTLNIDKVLYRKLNKVYESIVIAGEVGELSQTTLIEGKTYNESLSELLTILDQIYANNPYAYTLKSSRDSLKLFEDNLSYLTIKPKKDEMIVQGKSIYTGVKNDSSDSGKNYYGFDTSHRNYKTTTNIVGGLASFEYGLSDKTSVGVVLGGNNQDINFKGSSKIKGNSLYLGTFTKTDISNFKFMSGIGYQYTSADAERKVSNRYDSFSTGDKYDINSLNAFVEAKYVYNAELDWTVEPKVRLSYFYIDQDKTNEGYTPGQISMKTDAVNSNTADIEVGVDFVKSLYLNNGKLKNILSLGVIKTIGDKSKELSGYILGKEQDGKKFDIQGVELPKTAGKVSYNLELEEINGMIYTAGVGLEFAKDYNRNINVTVGVGYKF
ncbi:autotransporter domain-containing protein [Cetobacterium somerae]